MIAGYSSQLVSEFLDRWLSTPSRLHTTEAFHRALRTWRVRCAPLGTGIGTSGADRCGRTATRQNYSSGSGSRHVVRNDCCIALFRTGTSLVQLLVTPWGASLHGFWQTPPSAGRHRARPGRLSATARNTARAAVTPRVAVPSRSISTGTRPTIRARRQRSGGRSADCTRSMRRRRRQA